MAYKIKDIYPSQTTTGDAGWPDGKPRNIQGGVQGTGTPFEEKLFQDYEGSRQALFDEAGIEPSGQADRVGQSDFVDALQGFQKPASSIEIDNSGGVKIYDVYEKIKAESGYNPDTMPDNTEAVEFLEDMRRAISADYTFLTVQNYKDYKYPLPVGKTVRIKEREACFEVIVGTGTADGFGILASSEVEQSVKLMGVRKRVSIVALGAKASSDTDLFDSTPHVQYALDNYNSIVVPIGVFFVSSLYWERDNIEFAGLGFSSVIKQLPNTVGNIFGRDEQGYTRNNIYLNSIHSLTIDGNRYNQTSTENHGIAPHASYGFRIHHCHIKRISGKGVFFSKLADDVLGINYYVNQNRIDGCYDACVHLSAFSAGLELSGNIIGASTANHNVIIQNVDTRIFGNHIHNSGSNHACVYLAGTHSCQFYGNHLESAYTNGLRVEGLYDSLINSNLMIKHSRNNPGEFAGMILAPFVAGGGQVNRRLTISGNVITSVINDNGAPYHSWGIELTNPSVLEDSTITGNMLAGNAGGIKNQSEEYGCVYSANVPKPDTHLYNFYYNDGASRVLTAKTTVNILSLLGDSSKGVTAAYMVTAANSTKYGVFEVYVTKKFAAGYEVAIRDIRGDSSTELGASATVIDNPGDGSCVIEIAVTGNTISYNIDQLPVSLNGIFSAEESTLIV